MSWLKYFGILFLGIIIGGITGSVALGAVVALVLYFICYVSSCIDSTNMSDIEKWNKEERRYEDEYGDFEYREKHYK